MKVPLLAFLLVVLCAASPVWRNHGEAFNVAAHQSGTLAQADIDRIITALTAKETEFRTALSQYKFKRDAIVQTIGQGGQVSGEYHRTSQLTFDSTGQPVDKILFFPTPTLSGVGVSTDDLDSIFGMQFFALEASKAPLYNFKYVGKERIDELDLHVFEVTPKNAPDPKKVKDRLFQGRSPIGEHLHIQPETAAIARILKASLGEL